jgi:hypothetical protein
MIVVDVVDGIRKSLGIPWNDATYRHAFKVGDHNAGVKGIAATSLAILDPLQLAHTTGYSIHRGSLSAGQGIALHVRQHGTSRLDLR